MAVDPCQSCLLWHLHWTSISQNLLEINLLCREEGRGKSLILFCRIRLPSSFDPIRTNTPIDNTAIVPPDDDDDDDELTQSDCEVDGNNMKSVSRRMVNVNGFEKLGTTFIFTAQHFSKIYIGCGIF